MAVVKTACPSDKLAGLGAAEIAVLPDETAFDVLSAVRSCRGTGLECFDGLLEGGCLGPSELVVLHGESGSAKSVLLRNIVASYIAPSDVGGHGLPAVFIDTEGTFDVMLLVRLLAAATERKQIGIPTATLIEEALKRLVVIRPTEPIDLLRQLYQLRDVLTANPTTSLLIVDSMSAWQPIATAFPRALAPVMREAWKALGRLQQEHCLAVVVAHREDVNSMSVSSTNTGTMASRCCHLNVVRCAVDALGRNTSFATSRRGVGFSKELWFSLSEAGEAITVA